MTLPRRPSHEPYRVYSEREFLRLVKCEPQLGWTSRPTVGADSLRRETCSRAAGATTVDWQKIGLLSTAMLASATGAAAALLVAAGPGQVAVSGRRPVKTFPARHSTIASVRARAAVVVFGMSRRRPAPQAHHRGPERPRGRAAEARSRSRLAEARSRAGRSRARSVPAPPALPSAAAATRVPARPTAGPAANLQSRPTGSAATQRGGTGSGASRPADFSFER